jgi:pimeloyl-ACP methyl ester carboxylesterase
MPIVVLPRMLMQLVSLLILGAAIWLVWRWFDGYAVQDADGVWRQVRGPVWQLLLGLLGLVWSFGAGRLAVLLFMRRDDEEPREERAKSDLVLAPDGTALHVEAVGPQGAPTLILTHGWGLNATAWWYARHDLAKRFRVITWDLPGLGRSKRPMDGVYTIDRFAEALGAVVEWSDEERVVLVGHSIGGMTSQTFWRARPDLRQRVAGIVLVDTTHENPLRTMILSKLWLALQKPLIEPLCWLTVALLPLAWACAWLGYINGSNQLAMRLTGFGRYATRGQVDLGARLAAKGSPAVQAKGNLAMFHWQVTEELQTITVPTLVLVGDKDIITLPRASATIATAIPAARLQVFEGCNHMGFMERWPAYDAAIAQFASEVLAAKA